MKVVIFEEESKFSYTEHNVKAVIIRDDLGEGEATVEFEGGRQVDHIGVVKVEVEF